jgi:hypothetical protein
MRQLPVIFDDGSVLKSLRPTLRYASSKCSNALLDVIVLFRGKTRKWNYGIFRQTDIGVPLGFSLQIIPALLRSLA